MSTKRRIADRLITFLANLIFVMMLLDVLLQVISRYIMYKPFIWTEELARCLYIWLAFVGSAALMKNYEHITVDFILRQLSPYWEKRLKLVIDILMLFFFICVLFGGIRMMMDTNKVTLPSLPILRMADLYLSLVVGSICSSCYLIENIIQNFIYKKVLD